jgi:hypothetical protein
MFLRRCHCTAWLPSRRCAKDDPPYLEGGGLPLPALLATKKLPAIKDGQRVRQ